MRTLPPRLFLTAATAVMFLIVLLKTRPGFPGSSDTGALIGSAVSFWITFIIGVTIVAILYAIFARLLGTPTNQIGLKDERDNALENKAYAAGFWILFMGGFITIMSLGSEHNQMLVSAILTQVVAIGAILLIGLIDELKVAWIGLRHGG